MNGLPVFVSLPHFLHADPYYNNQLKGLHPEENRHETSLVVEPNTGITIESTSRFQINMLLSSNPDIG